MHASAPSGIAQLRSSVDHQASPTMQSLDSMNLDDFIVPSSVASPAGLSPSAAHEPDSTSTSATAPGIPIRRPSQTNDQDLLLRASAPSVPPAVQRGSEFGYVQRHVRKTSIDERRVSRTEPHLCIGVSLPYTTSPPRDEQKHRLKFQLSTAL